MRKVSIGFSKPHDLSCISKAIMAVEDTDFSHSFVTWKDRDIDRRKVFEAVGAGVRIVGNKFFKSKSKIIHLFEFEVNEKIVVWLDQYSHDNAGKPYGYKHILGLLLMRIGNWGARKVGKPNHFKNPFKDGNYSQICVEAGAYVIEQGLGVDLPGNVEDYGLREYLAFCRQHGKEVEQERIDRINARR